MAYTIKERAFYIDHNNPPPADCVGPINTFVPAENIVGPFANVSQRYEDGYLVVTGHYHGDDTPGVSFGPWSGLSNDCPRPTVWVMNENGATVATYQM